MFLSQSRWFSPLLLHTCALHDAVSEPFVDGCATSLRMAMSLLTPCEHFLAATPVTEAQFKMFKQAMGEQGLSRSSTQDVSMH
jgi:hypothetical protein